MLRGIAMCGGGKVFVNAAEQGSAHQQAQTATEESSRQRLEGRRINVIFRLDDFSARSATDLELKIIDAFRESNISLTLSVIPFACAGDSSDPSPQDVIPLDLTKAEILKAGLRGGILDVALHGYSHQTISGEQLAEFSGSSYDHQVERLSKGKRFLEGILDAPVSIFVPPWNRYDLSTIRALEELGFFTLSADLRGKTAKYSKLHFLPASCVVPQLRAAVRAARTSSHNQPLIVVFFHQYDFREIDEKQGCISLQEFRELLDWVKAQRDVRSLSMSQAPQVIRDLSASRYLLAKWNYSLEKLLPSPLREEGSMSLYPESTELARTIRKLGRNYLGNTPRVSEMMLSSKQLGR